MLRHKLVNDGPRCATQLAQALGCHLGMAGLGLLHDIEIERQKHLLRRKDLRCGEGRLARHALGVAVCQQPRREEACQLLV